MTSHHLMTIYILNQIFLYFYFILLFARFGTASQNESNNAKSCEQKACESEMRWRIRFFFFIAIQVITRSGNPLSFPFVRLQLNVTV